MAHGREGDGARGGDAGHRADRADLDADAAWTRVILHADLDAFFASVEQLDHPEWRGRPVLVGGRGARSVVAAASYEARRHGCRSAMPMAHALRLCPDAIVAPPRGARYRELSASFMAILGRIGPDVEPLSVDEAFVDATGSQRLHGSGARMAELVRGWTRSELGVTVSVGVAASKFVAKIASDLHKPDGVTVIEPGRTMETLAPLPIDRMWGVGPRTLPRVQAAGIRTFGDLQALDEDEARRRLGDAGAHWWSLARGVDARDVVTGRQARSIGHEETFGSDLPSEAAVAEHLLPLVEDTARRLRRHGVRAGTVTLKIRLGDFSTFTRAQSLDEATDRTDTLWDVARGILRAWAATGFRPVRLIGVQCSNLERGLDAGGLFPDHEHARQRALDAATDRIAERFGARAVRRGGVAGREPSPPS
jgi:DNA polymerase-4